MGGLQKASVHPGKLLGSPSSLWCKVQLGMYPGSVYVAISLYARVLLLDTNDDATAYYYSPLLYHLTFILHGWVVICGYYCVGFSD